MNITAMQRMFWYVGMLVWCSIPSARASGGIATDGTMGIQQTLSGATVTIPQGMGRTVNNNVFHSFTQFNINEGQTVLFTENTSNTVNNVIARVTGGAVSAIEGTLRSTPGGHADFYLINPQGVTFGPNAQIDVPAAFHVSTAHHLTFQDGRVYSATHPSVSILSSAAPASFGFLNSSTANNSLINVNGAHLKLPTGGSVDFVGGTITLENKASLTAPAGGVRLVAVGAGNIEVPLSPDVVPTTHGNLQIDSSTIDTSGNGAGHVLVRSGSLSITNGSLLSANNTGVNDAASDQGVDLRIDTGSFNLNNGKIHANATNAGRAGNIVVTSAGDLSVTSGGSMDTSTTDTGRAGNITITSGGNITVDDKNAGIPGSVTGIYSYSNVDGMGGDAGTVSVTAKGNLSIVNNAGIDTSTIGTGNAGNVTVTVGGTLTIDAQGLGSGIFSAAYQGSGNGGNVLVTSKGDLSILDGGLIYSATADAGKAGRLTIQSGGKLIIDGNDGVSGARSGIFSATEQGSGDAGTLSVITKGDIAILNGGSINSSTAGTGKAGSVTVQSGGQLTINDNGFGLDTGIYSQSTANGTGGDAGPILVTSVGNLSLLHGGSINSSTFSTGRAGNITVTSGGTLNIDGTGSLSHYVQDPNAINTVFDTGIFSDTQVGSNDDAGSHGGAGDVLVNARGTLSLFAGGAISSSTYTTGKAGNVTVNSGDNMRLDGNSTDATGIFATAKLGSSGDAGTVSVTTQGGLSLFNGGQISTSTDALGDAGGVNVVIARALHMEATSCLATLCPVNTSISSTSGEGAAGAAGPVSVVARGGISLLNGGFIDTTTYSSMKAGDVTITSGGRLTIDGINTGIYSDVSLDAAGTGGTVLVTSQGDLSIVNGGMISSSLIGRGSAGNVTVKSGGDLTIDAKGVGMTSYRGTGIFSDATIASDGDAGTVSVTSLGDLSIVNGGIISSATFGTGKAGSVAVISAGDLTIRGQNNPAVPTWISAASMGSASSGQTGDVWITANHWIHLAGGGAITINNEANLPNATDAAQIIPGAIAVTAPDITLQNSTITTTSTGNVGSGRITINPSHVLSLDPSSINTSANIGNGGSITINGTGAGIYLGGSEMITTVNGVNGNGGDIQIKAGALVMNTGLIQANALSGNGGNITLSIDSLIVSNNQLQKGGQRLLDATWNANTDTFGFNVIQAVSATGISGTVDVAAPQINISGLIANLGGPQFGSSLVGSDYCALGAGSSLTRKGHGGLKRKAGNLTTF